MIVENTPVSHPKSGQAIMIGLVILLAALVAAASVIGYRVIKQRSNPPPAVVAGIGEEDAGLNGQNAGGNGTSRPAGGFCGDNVCDSPVENNETCQLDCCPLLEGFLTEGRENGDLVLTWRSRIPSLSTVRHGLTEDGLDQVIREEGDSQSEHRVILPVGTVDSPEYFFQITYSDGEGKECRERTHSLEL